MTRSEASKAARRQPSLEFSPISTARRPLIVEPRQVVIERTLPGSEDVVTFAADHLSHQLPAMASLTSICLIGMPIFDRAMIAASVSSRRR
jgi:hypothetical protein